MATKNDFSVRVYVDGNLLTEEGSFSLTIKNPCQILIDEEGKVIYSSEHYASLKREFKYENVKFLYQLQDFSGKVKVEIEYLNDDSKLILDDVRLTRVNYKERVIEAKVYSMYSE
jgi:hypothetical protein